MKIRHMSDLHLEFGPLTLQKVPADVLILAGDIGVKTQGAVWALKVARDLDIPTVMIAGNHEHYAGHTERGSVQDVIHDCMEIAEKVVECSTFSKRHIASLMESSSLVALCGLISILLILSHSQ